jgi:hypothetical protein
VVPVYELDLEGAVERLGGGVVQGASDPAHRLGHAQRAADRRGLGVFRSAVRMVSDQDG